MLPLLASEPDTHATKFALWWAAALKRNAYHSATATRRYTDVTIIGGELKDAQDAVKSTTVPRCRYSRKRELYCKHAIHQGTRPSQYHQEGRALDNGFDLPVSAWNILRRRSAGVFCYVGRSGSSTADTTARLEASWMPCAARSKCRTA